jgi:hypothetical protein
MRFFESFKPSPIYDDLGMVWRPLLEGMLEEMAQREVPDIVQKRVETTELDKFFGCSFPI